jgi:hypothetical protein
MTRKSTLLSALAFIASLTILFSSCAPVAPVKPATSSPASTNTTPATQKSAPAKPVTYTNDQYGFSVTYPGEWEVVTWPNTIFYARNKMTVPVVNFVVYEPGKLIDRGNEVIAADKGKNTKWGDPVDFTAADGKTKGKLYQIDWDYPGTPLTTLLFAVNGKTIYATYTNVASWYKEADAKAILSTLSFR